ncbi:DNA-deoxyinosine glycosylase [Helicobacter sp. 13S00477-4]|uniref:DNA-deoxyinosine glycosylase n=1 Tax=Helicobacter sp. 13S00477-4 TaxID=1905759 RepID=UPI000BA6E4B8|nr:DNA-deoxyinosine glycosylase [Helicobacter sp. 13S00477-4]PAF50609.1 DNA-deoxyinosine glycosylase [Helicobacter sp. 13S00477-4]
MKHSWLKHPFAPIYDKNSEILILGTFPSQASRKGFYYEHPQNRFWKIISSFFPNTLLKDKNSKIKVLLQNHIALWDVIESCEIVGSSDASIKNIIPNNIAKILQNAPIKNIFTNGKKAADLYMKFCYSSILKDVIILPSTSPANAKYNLDTLKKEWKIICLD